MRRRPVLEEGLLALACIGAGAAWLGYLMGPRIAAASLGPICTHGGGVFGHCPGCYAAAALILAGLALLAHAGRLAAGRPGGVLAAAWPSPATTGSMTASG